MKIQCSLSMEETIETLQANTTMGKFKFFYGLCLSTSLKKRDPRQQHVPNAGIADRLRRHGLSGVRSNTTEDRIIPGDRRQSDCFKVLKQTNMYASMRLRYAIYFLC